jgi:hypothetical protein
MSKDHDRHEVDAHRRPWRVPDFLGAARSYYVNVIPPPETPPGGGIPLVLNPYGQPAGRSLWSDQSTVTIFPVGSGLKETEAYLPIFFPDTADETPRHLSTSSRAQMCVESTSA